MQHGPLHAWVEQAPQRVVEFWVVMSPAFRLLKVLPELTISPTIVDRPEPAHAKPELRAFNEIAQEAVLAVVVRVAEVLVLHRCLRCCLAHAKNCDRVQ